jgi:fructosamine-3-kinase
MRVAGVELFDARPVSGGDICRAFAARTIEGDRVFAKTLTGAPPGFFEAEAAGLNRLRTVGGPPVPRVHAVDAGGLVLEWVEPSSPSKPAARAFGHSLARLHRRRGDSFGAASNGFVATVAVDNSPVDEWPSFHAERRLHPALRVAADRGAIDADAAQAVEGVIEGLPALAGPPEPPARIHGDLWAGNLLWAAAGHVWLVDAAGAHDGHRETDLAMLALFGAPHLGDIMAAYDEIYPRAEGWQARIALHQIHPLLIHAALFGGGYGTRAGDAARAALAGSL